MVRFVSAPDTIPSRQRRERLPSHRPGAASVRAFFCQRMCWTNQHTIGLVGTFETLKACAPNLGVEFFHIDSSTKTRLALRNAMHMRIASWNVNSVRLRAEQVARFVREQSPDVICLQEIKCRESEFPTDIFVEAGLPHLRIAGQKGFHGVAIASRLPIDDAPHLDVCREGHARSVSARVAGVEIQNFYVPAGGDLPDREANAKFDHKLDFFEKLTAQMALRDPIAPLVIAGDLNVAPGDNDVWSHKQMSKIVSHTPVEVSALLSLKASNGFIDLAREAVPEPQKLYSWWSYRSPDFRQSSRGLRLDHLWVTPGLRDAAFRSGSAAARVHLDARGWDRPSDHAPISIDLAL